MSFEPRDYLHHIQLEADYLARQSAGLSVEEFLRQKNREQERQAGKSGSDKHVRHAFYIALWLWLPGEGSSGK